MYDADIVVSYRIGDIDIDVVVEDSPAWLDFVTAHAPAWPLAANAWVNLFGLTIDGEGVGNYADLYFWMVDGEWTTSHPELRVIGST